MSTKRPNDLPSSPAGLSDRAGALWDDVVAAFELSPAELTLLHEGLVALDRAAQAGAVIDAEGVTVLDRYGSPKSHPACDIEARNRTIFASVIRQLGVKLADAEPTKAGRPAYKATLRTA